MLKFAEKGSQQHHYSTAGNQQKVKAAGYRNINQSQKNTQSYQYGTDQPCRILRRIESHFNPLFRLNAKRLVLWPGY